MPVPIHVPPPQAHAPSPAAPTDAVNEEEAEEEIDILISSLAITKSRLELYFCKANLAFSYPTGFFADGRKHTIYDILCQPQHRDYYHVMMGLGGTSFRLQARIPPSFLDITGRIESKLDVHNLDTMVVIALARRASDFLGSVHGSDFDNLWTEGEEFPLAFKGLPNLHTQII
jgi:hypothetical protein